MTQAPGETESFKVTDVLVGIAWIAVEGNPLLFEILGLGMGRQIS